MKKVRFLLLLFLTSFFATAQNNFIEVEVQDTLLIKPITISYTISVNDSGWTIYPPLSAQGATIPEDAIYNPENDKADYDKKIRELKDALIKKGYKPALLSDNAIVSLPEYTDENCIVKLKDLSQIKKLQTDMEDFIYADINVREADLGDKAQYENKLLKKLADRAKVKAQGVATATGQKLGKILQFKENKLENEGLPFNVQDTYLQSAGYGLVVRNGVVYDVLTLSATVRFEAL